MITLDSLGTWNLEHTSVQWEHIVLFLRSLYISWFNLRSTCLTFVLCLNINFEINVEFLKKCEIPKNE